MVWAPLDSCTFIQLLPALYCFLASYQTHLESFFYPVQQGMDEIQLPIKNTCSNCLSWTAKEVRDCHKKL